MTIKEGMELNVTHARWVSGYVLDIDFSDGVSRPVDFEPFLSGSVQPGIRKYLDIEQFKAFEISYGNLIWNDYDLCFPIEDLYSGRLTVYREPNSLVAESSPEYRLKDKTEN